jgi:hypothetical protein
LVKYTTLSIIKTMQNNIRFLEISVENYYIERDAKSRQ